MASSSSLSLLGFKQLSVYLVDCLKTPADLGPAVRLEPEDSADHPSVLAVKELSVCLVDCMKAPGLNRQVVHVAAEQSHAGVEVELDEEDEQSEADMINPELDQQPDWCDIDIGAEINLYKEELGASESDDKDPNQEEAKTEDMDELQPSHAGADGTLMVIQEGGGSSDGVTWLMQDYELSESLKTATPSDAGGDSEERQKEADRADAKSSGNVAKPEQRKAEGVEASEPAGGGKCFYNI
ncbi:uncharacterized protein LOC122870274 [Siniperca chuatsi]|uniref:uncharacterized protein LOC122870274 n=1 Tax=Siniperca chuatsi TaxID=119488 RepID=UPI001CE1F8A0|nr:uncharacterized protein LOC122870274 [Siniperca chuatsi]XP_044040338.1 uncharacterized protein LOC122870274 [Siniperca chuatsi]XP_044040339.1 uncharacterized protein LOC122870274 [Siniperca chuatsi]